MATARTPSPLAPDVQGMEEAPPQVARSESRLTSCFLQHTNADVAMKQDDVPQMSVAHVIDRLIRLLALSDGRDKIIKVFQV